ncbi:MAG: ABC transporter permease [Albidovulum sp.]|nr:ABC transporter permease [Albidovulum sp.]
MRAGNLRAFAKILRANLDLTASLLILLILAILAVFGPFLWPYDPLAISLRETLQPPSLAHPMGTDHIGRDIFARFNEGALISLSVGVAVVITGAVVGGMIGLVSGISGGLLDNALMRLMDAILAFPPLILAMAVTVGLGGGLETAAFGIMLTSVPYYARLIRSDVIRIRQLPFVEAAETAGAGPARIILRHIVPHTVSTLLIQAAALFGYSVLALAALGFVGLGTQVPTPEWGVMITEGLQYALTGQWWIGVFPGFGLLAAVAATSILADKVRDLVDPRGQYAQL